MSFSFVRDLRLGAVDAPLDGVPEVVFDHLHDVEDHHALRLLETKIHRIVELVKVILRVERSVNRAVARHVAQRAVEPVLDRLVVVGAPDAFEVGSRDEDVEQVGEAGLLVPGRGPRVEVFVRECRAGAAPVLSALKF